MTDGLFKLPKGKEHLHGLRINDLVAKIARVTIKDTTRVLLAFDAVVDFMDCPADDILEQDVSVERASPESSDACNRAYKEFRKYLKATGDEDFLDALKSLD